MDALKDPGTTHFSQLDIKRRTHSIEIKDGGMNVTTETHTDVTDPLSTLPSNTASLQHGLASKVDVLDGRTASNVWLLLKLAV